MFCEELACRARKRKIDKKYESEAEVALESEFHVCVYMNFNIPDVNGFRLFVHENIVSRLLESQCCWLENSEEKKDKTKKNGMLYHVNAFYTQGINNCWQPAQRQPRDVTAK